MTIKEPDISCTLTVKDGLAVVVYLLCLSMIATISWYNYSTSSKLHDIIHDVQKTVTGSGAHFVDFEYQDIQH